LLEIREQLAFLQGSFFEMSGKIRVGAAVVEKAKEVERQAAAQEAKPIWLEANMETICLRPSYKQILLQHSGVR